MAFRPPKDTSQAPQSPNLQISKSPGGLVLFPGRPRRAIHQRSPLSLTTLQAPQSLVCDPFDFAGQLCSAAPSLQLAQEPEPGFLTILRILRPQRGTSSCIISSSSSSLRYNWCVLCTVQDQKSAGVQYRPRTFFSPSHAIPLADRCPTRPATRKQELSPESLEFRIPSIPPESGTSSPCHNSLFFSFFFCLTSSRPTLVQATPCIPSNAAGSTLRHSLSSYVKCSRTRKCCGPRGAARRRLDSGP